MALGHTVQGVALGLFGLWAGAFGAIGCSGDVKSPGATTIEVWAHAGRQSERETIEDQILRYNRIQRDVRIQLVMLPEGSYNGQVQAAALAGDLPDVVEFDGPYVSNYVWQGKLRPLDTLLKKELIADLLPSIVSQGSYRERLFSVGTFDSGLGLYARRSMLEKIDTRLPTSPQDAWSIDEFDAILDALAKLDADGMVIDLKSNYTGEWYAYGFSPAIQSAGGDLINRPAFDTSGSILNGPAAVFALQRIQAWFKKGQVDPNLDDDAFVSGRVALSWVGHWEYARYSKTFGEDLAILPLPDFGNGSKSGQGSWNWGITTVSKNPEMAARFLTFLLSTEEVLKITNANGAVPSTYSVISRSRRYAPGGPLHLYAEQLSQGFTVARPQTPAYPIISSAFEQAFRDIRDGANVKPALDRAARIIDSDIRDNRGYPWLFANKLGVP